MIFEYKISATFDRLHCNPPQWTNLHHHSFRVTLHLEAERTTGIYGLDMCEAERLLQEWGDRLPESINDVIPSGTTEDLCLYFAQCPIPEGARLRKVAVSETPERVCVLSF